MSKLFWAVFDAKQKEKTEEILATFEKEAKDEMGLMSITIALSNLLFPGTSVLHTRLKYVFFVGWIFLRAFDSKKDFTQSLHYYEKQLRYKLQKARDEGKKSDFLGLLGSTKIVKISKKENPEADNLSQPPFSIYFNLLKAWNIIKPEFKHISISELRDESMFDTKYLSIIKDKEFDMCSFKLTKIQKDYIKEKLPKSFLKTYLEGKYSSDIRFIEFDGVIDDEVQSHQLKMAQYFSILMWGSMIYYDYYLGNKSDEIKAKFDEWKVLLDKLPIEYKPQDTLELIKDDLNDKSLHEKRVMFINSWFEFVTKNKSHLELDTTIAIVINRDRVSIKEFLLEREYQLKADKSRLKQLSIQKIQEDSAARYGFYPLEYRWGNIMRFKRDF